MTEQARKSAKGKSDGEMTVVGRNSTDKLHNDLFLLKYLFDTMSFSNHCATYKIASNLSNPTTLGNVSASLPFFPLFFSLFFLLSHPSLPSASLASVPHEGIEERRKVAVEGEYGGGRSAGQGWSVLLT